MLRETLERDPELIPVGSRVLIAVSGGGDSIALLHLLCELRGERGLVLHAAHFDHALRPSSSAEAEAVAAAAARLGVPCTIGRARGLAGDQAGCRVARYRFLEETADRTGSDRIALAHQRDDQVETVLFRLMRGTGLRGLCGIPARRGRFVRPLLGCGREELRRYARAVGATWIEDASNRDARYARARIRHALLPALRVAGQLDADLLRLSGDAGRADAGLRDRAAALGRAAVIEGGGRSVRIARSRAAGYDPAELARILRMLAREQGFELSRGGTRSGVAFVRRGPSGGGVDLAEGLRLTREYECLRLGPPEVAERRTREIAIAEPGSGEARIEIAGKEFHVGWTVDESVPSPGDRRCAVFPLSALRFPLQVGDARPGDRMRTRAGSKKLKKLLNERRVPRSRRHRLPVLRAADGHVLWVAGIEVAQLERTGPGDRVERMLRIEIDER